MYARLYVFKVSTHTVARSGRELGPLCLLLQEISTPSVMISAAIDGYTILYNALSNCLNTTGPSVVIDPFYTGFLFSCSCDLRRRLLQHPTFESA